MNMQRTFIIIQDPKNSMKIIFPIIFIKNVFKIPSFFHLITWVIIESRTARIHFFYKEKPCLYLKDFFLGSYVFVFTKENFNFFKKNFLWDQVEISRSDIKYYFFKNLVYPIIFFIAVIFLTLIIISGMAEINSPTHLFKIKLINLIIRY
jgi:hypothetical protein